MSSSKSDFYVNKCCCCINLQTGCFILGYLGLIGIILTAVMVAIGLGAGIAAAKSDKYVQFAPLLIAIGCVLIFFLILALAFNIVLLVGLHMDKPGHVKAYLIYNTIFLVIYAIILLVTIIAGYANLVTIMTRIIHILISIYFLLVFRSHYLDMKGTSNQQV